MIDGEWIYLPNRRVDWLFRPFDAEKYGLGLEVYLNCFGSWSIKPEGRAVSADGYDSAMEAVRLVEMGVGL